MKRSISSESIILTLICLADMFSTLFLVSAGAAGEQNPIMAACLRQGAWFFVLAKAASFMPFIVAIEWYRQQNPRFARVAARTAIALYVSVYIVLTARINIA